MGGAVVRWLDEAAPWRVALVVFAVLLGVYLPTATYDGPAHSNDALTTALAAGRFAHAGDLTLDDFVDEREDLLLWLVESGGRTVTDRFPGTIFHAVPFYWLAPADLSTTDATQFPLWPAGVAAATLAAAAMAVLFTVLRRVASGRAAFLATLVAGVATPTWGVSADQLWTHGPGQLWLAAGMLGLAAGRPARSGLAFAVAVLVRPPNAVAAAGAGLYGSLRRRDWRPAVLLGATAVLGVAGLLAYNHVLFAGLSGGGYAAVTGGYNSYPVDQLASMSPARYGTNVLATLFSVDRGVFAGSPFVAMLVPGLARAWKSSPDWVRAAAVGGLAQLLFQLSMTNYTGGGANFSYRFPLEMLTLAAPLLLLCYRSWTAEKEWRKVVFLGLLVGAVAIQGIGATMDYVCCEGWR